MTPPLTLYKVLAVGGRSCHGGSHQWSLPTQNPDGTTTPGVSVRVEGTLVPCKRGIHLATANQVVQHWLGARVWVAQWRGKLINAHDKWVAREVRLLHGTGWDDRTARHFAADCATHVLTADADPLCWAAVRAARLFADGRIGQEELDAASAALRSASAALRSASAALRSAFAALRPVDAFAYYADAAAYYAAATAADAAAAAAERTWQTERFEHYLRGGQPEDYT